MYTNPFNNIPTGTVTSTSTVPNPLKQLTQHKVVVFRVVRNEKGVVTNSEYLKEMWIQTKNGESIQFEVARDKDLVEYKASDLCIRILHSHIIS